MSIMEGIISYNVLCIRRGREVCIIKYVAYQYLIMLILEVLIGYKTSVCHKRVRQKCIAHPPPLYPPQYLTQI